MYNSNYCERAIPLVAVNDSTGSKIFVKVQNIK